MIKRIESGKIMSRATVHNNMIYFGGHVAGGKQATIGGQAAALFKRYDELLEQYGTDKNHIIFATIYLTDLDYKDGFNKEWEKWMEEGNTPARVCVEVGLGQGYLVEMTLIAELK